MGIALIFFKVGVIFFARRFGSPAAFTFLENVHPDLSLLNPEILEQKKLKIIANLFCHIKIMCYLCIVIKKQN